jgi:hypothetical protein
MLDTSLVTYTLLNVIPLVRGLEERAFMIGNFIDDHEGRTDIDDVRESLKAAGLVGSDIALRKWSKFSDDTLRALRGLGCRLFMSLPTFERKVANTDNDNNNNEMSIVTLPRKSIYSRRRHRFRHKQNV